MAKRHPIEKFDPRKDYTIDELAAMQGVGPVDDVDALFALWPEGDDPDAMWEAILADRKERRTLTETKKPV